MPCSNPPETRRRCIRHGADSLRCNWLMKLTCHILGVVIQSRRFPLRPPPTKIIFFPRQHVCEVFFKYYDTQNKQSTPGLRIYAVVLQSTNDFFAQKSHSDNSGHLVENVRLVGLLQKQVGQKFAKVYNFQIILRPRGALWVPSVAAAQLFLYARHVTKQPVCFHVEKKIC